VAFDWKLLRPFRTRMQQWLWRPQAPIKPLPQQVKVRLLLQDLGPTYVKLGQIVSSQSRVLPLAWEEELAKLQSDVRPFPYDDVREFGSTLLRELDYTIEAYNARRLARVLAPIDGVHVPAVEPTLSSDRVLTLEFVEGVKSTDAAAIDAAGLDREELARSLVR